MVSKGAMVFFFGKPLLSLQLDGPWKL